MISVADSFILRLRLSIWHLKDASNDDAESQNLRLAAKPMYEKSNI